MARMDGRVVAHVVGESHPRPRVVIAAPAVAAALEGKQVVKEIYVKGRLVNLAVKG